jgi:hypothetical protein
LENTPQGYNRGNYSTNLILLDDYSVMGIAQRNHCPSGFLLGVCIPNVGFLFTALSLENGDFAPITYIASHQLDGSPNTYYGLIQFNYPQGIQNAGLCAIRATPIHMDSYDLDNYIDEIALAQDMLENDKSSFVAQYYNKLMTEEVAINSMHTIGRHASEFRTQPLDKVFKRIETLFT